jgi:monoamine oxidase
MKGMNYSSITAMLRRIHRAKSISDETGIPVRELIDRDRELRKKLLQEREVAKQRRDFLKTAGGLGLGAGMIAMNSPAFAGKPTCTDNPTDIAIIGAGAGGIRTAHRLMQYGIASTVYEASERVGGRLYSKPDFGTVDENDHGRMVEYGGEFISTEHTAIRNLAHQLGLKLEDANKLSVGDEETYLIDGKLHSEYELMDVWVKDLYDVMKRALQDAPWQPQYNTANTPKQIEYDNLDAIDWMTQLGYPSSNWVHRLLLADLIAEYGITEGNSALNLIYLLGWNTRNSGGLPLAGTDERLHVVEGNDQIVKRMEKELPTPVQTEKKLVAIRGVCKRGYGGPFELTFADGSSTTCKILVLSLPMNLIKEIDIADDIYMNFSPQKRAGFESHDNVSDNGKVIMEFETRFWDQSRTIEETGERVHQAARAYSFTNRRGRDKWTGFISTWEGDPGHPSNKGILVNYNGGHEARSLRSSALHGLADPADVDRVLVQAEMIWPGISAKYIPGTALVSNWIDDPLAKSAFTSPTVGTMTSWWGAQWESDIPGNIFFAGEAYDEEYWSYMNGAILSGERIAKEIAQS